MMMAVDSIFIASTQRKAVGHKVLQAFKRPVIAELNLFDICPVMRHVENLIQLQEPDRVISRFRLWAPLFNNDSALESTERYEQLIGLVRTHIALSKWHASPAGLAQDPIIFSALPPSLTREIIEKLTNKPSFLSDSRWSLHQLSVVARASILDDLTSA
jgi:hypothetical protein